MKNEKILSVLIDESGDFGRVDQHDPYYHVVMVLHEQNKSISGMVSAFENKLYNWGYDNHYVHVGPLIRREKPYINELRETRRSLFNALFHFTRTAPINYIGITLDKRKCNEDTGICYVDTLTKQIVAELKKNYEYFTHFDRIIVYYDYGQDELARIIVSVFNALFANVEFRNDKPTEKVLLQVADLICTVQMISVKETLSKSEIEFFYSKSDFKKNILKQIIKKEL
ncbi:MAG: DUF3800 domain-containing protein [Saccharofermentans sp.]|jgi:hypothetical protein|nr:DUF3800 domain-containing protein [Saccharofermentans sp.]